MPHAPHLSAPPIIIDPAQHRCLAALAALRPCKGNEMRSPTSSVVVPARQRVNEDFKAVQGSVELKKDWDCFERVRDSGRCTYKDWQQRVYMYRCHI